MRRMLTGRRQRKAHREIHGDAPARGYQGVYLGQVAEQIRIALECTGRPPP